MYTKKILSAAAALAIASSAVVAFETDTTGKIYAVNSAGDQVAGGYTGGVPAAAELNLSSTQLGDGLIYPFYQADEGWATEIIVRNTTPHATVAKASFFGYENSSDAGDFNIYLSPYDVARFTVKLSEDGTSVIVESEDGSIPQQVTSPYHGVENDNAIFEHNAHDQILQLEDLKQGERKGYLTIIGMTQYNDGDSRSATKNGANTDVLNYHHKHLELFQDYRRVLDDCRSNWRSAYNQAGMINGMMTVSVPAPDTNIGCATTSDSVVDGYDLANFGDVAADSLIGTVRVYKEDGEQSRDLLLPATALRNFTADNMMLWAEGELAALHDRRIEDGAYLGNDVLADAATFEVSSAYYTFSDDEGAANQLTVTQPMKKILGQLITPTASTIGQYMINDGSRYGGFQLSYFLRDEDENDPVEIEVGLTEITSPYNVGTVEASTFPDEMQVITDTDLELSDAASDPFKNKEVAGFAYLTFVGGDANTIPAIVTQMTGSKVGGIAQTNWIYAPTVQND